jgi:hypothetical protein
MSIGGGCMFVRALYLQNYLTDFENNQSYGSTTSCHEAITSFNTTLHEAQIILITNLSKSYFYKELMHDVEHKYH